MEGRRRSNAIYRDVGGAVTGKAQVTNTNAKT